MDQISRRLQWITIGVLSETCEATQLLKFISVTSIVLKTVKLGKHIQNLCYHDKILHMIELDCLLFLKLVIDKVKQNRLNYRGSHLICDFI